MAKRALRYEPKRFPCLDLFPVGGRGPERVRSRFMSDESGILILRNPIEKTELARLVKRWFGDMVKYVADVERGVVAIGGDLHADAEEALLEDGSRQAALWGANYYPGSGPGRCIEYTSLINIRP